MSRATGTLAGFRSAAQGFAGSALQEEQIQQNSSEFTDPGPTVLAGPGDTLYSWPNKSATGGFIVTDTITIVPKGTMWVKVSVTGGIEKTINDSVFFNWQVTPTSTMVPELTVWSALTWANSVNNFGDSRIFRITEEVTIALLAPAATYTNMSLHVTGGCTVLRDKVIN